MIVIGMIWKMINQHEALQKAHGVMPRQPSTNHMPCHRISLYFFVISPVLRCDVHAQDAGYLPWQCIVVGQGLVFFLRGLDSQRINFITYMPHVYHPCLITQ